MEYLRIGISSIGRFHMFDLARQLIRLGQDVSLFTGYPRFKIDRDLQPFTKTHSIWVLAEHLRRRFPPAPKTTWWADRGLADFGPWLARSIGSLEIDILDAIAGTGLEAGRILHQEGKPWVCNRGSTHILTQKQLLEEEHARWQVRRPYFSAEGLDRCLTEYAEADAIVAPSTFVKRSFVEQGVSADKMYLCPYGVDVSMFHPQPKEDDRFRVLFVGSYSVRKGIGYLFEAVRPLVQKGIVELWLVGSADTEARDILRRNSDMFIDKGPHPRSELFWFYSQASVLVLPSVEEGLAMVQAQVMACGLPVIATTNTGAEDLFTDGVEGFIVPIRDPKAIRDKIQWMLDNPVKRQEMGHAALQRVQSLGGWDTYGERCLAMYREVLHRKGCAV